MIDKKLLNKNHLIDQEDVKFEMVFKKLIYEPLSTIFKGQKDKQLTFTPFELIRKCIERAGNKVSGNILVYNIEYVKVLIKEYFVDPLNITFYIDIGRNKSEIAEKAFGIKNFIFSNDIEHIYNKVNNKVVNTKDMKFNAIFGNPAYNGEFHLEMLKEILKYMDDKGTCVWLHPASWAQDPLCVLKNGNTPYNKYKDLPWISFDVIPVDEANNLFKTGIPSDLVISVLNKNNKNINPNILVNPIERSIVDKIITCKTTIGTKLENWKEDGIRVKLREIINLPGNFHGQKANEDSVCIVLYKHDQIFINGINKNGISWKDIGQPNGQNKKSIKWSIKFNSYTEAENYVNSIKTKIFMGLIAITKKNSHVPFNFLPYFDDYTKSWTNEDIINLFKFSDKEVKYIYNIINKYISE